MVDYVLRTAFENHQRVTIIYMKGNKITERSIMIRKIENEDIEAYCYLRHQIRHFKKENILSAINIL